MSRSRRPRGGGGGVVVSPVVSLTLGDRDSLGDDDDRWAPAGATARPAWGPEETRRRASIDARMAPDGPFYHADYDDEDLHDPRDVLHSRPPVVHSEALGAWAGPPRALRRTGFPAIVLTPERIVRVDVREDEALGAGFLLYFDRGIVVYSLNPGQALDRTGALEVGDVIVAVNGVSLACGSMPEALDLVRQSLPEVEFLVKGYVDPDEIHLLEVLPEDYDDVGEQGAGRNGLDAGGRSSGGDESETDSGGFAYPDFSAYSAPAGDPGVGATDADWVRWLALRLVAAPVVVALSCVFFFLGIVEGLARLFRNTVASIGQTPGPVMSGENLCYDVIMALWYTVLLDDPTDGVKSTLYQSSTATGVVLGVKRAEIFASTNKDEFARHLKNFRGTRIVHQRQPDSAVRGDMEALLSARRRKIASQVPFDAYIKPGSLQDTTSGVAVGRVPDPMEDVDEDQKQKVQLMNSTAAKSL